MLVTSADENADQEEKEQDIFEHENNRQRKRSLLRKFVDVIFYDEEEETDQSPSQTKLEKSTQGDPKKGDKEIQKALRLKEDPESDDTRKQLALELRKLDRDRKKSLLVRVIYGLLYRSDHIQQNFSTDSIEDHAAMDIVNDENATGDSYWTQEELEDIEREANLDNNSEVDSVKGELEVYQEDKPRSVSVQCRQRRSGVVSCQLGQSNLGFEDETIKEIEEECSSDTSGQRRQKKSITFSLSELPVQPLMNTDGGKDSGLDASVEKLPTVADRCQEDDKETEHVKVGCYPSTSEDKQEVRGLPASSPIHPAEKRRPKTIKHWLRDPSLYKVCLSRI